MARWFSWRSPVSLSLVAILAVFAPLMIAMLDNRTYVDINSARLMDRWETGFLVVPFTTEVVDTDFSRLAAEFRETEDAAAPVWKPASSRFPFAAVYPHYRYTGTPNSLRLLATLIDHLDMDQEERAALIARALDLLREDQPRELDGLARELGEKACQAGEKG